MQLRYCPILFLFYLFNLVFSWYIFASLRIKVLCITIVLTSSESIQISFKMEYINLTISIYDFELILKGKAPNRPILRYSINVSHSCIVIFFINKIWPEFAKLLDTSPITIHKFYSTGLDGLNETFFSIYLKFIMLCRKSTLYSCFPVV